MGMQNPQALQMILAYLMANQADGGQQLQGMQHSLGGGAEMEHPDNPYLGQPNRPSLTGLSPVGRYNDMVYRQAGRLANNLADGKQAVAENTERQRLVESLTHPAPAMPYHIQQLPSSAPGAAPALLNSAYGKGSVSFAPPGSAPHGTFGSDGLPFGTIGGAHEAQPIEGDPAQTTYQQQMIMDSIQKALGRKR